ncbi:hypothetical protein Mal64_25030 [Pseudobythopirellula maris]|uniref:Secreted protein n=1 Tax=Pseudobythopirellula maris TaxID=2527991 RepID=A0A5C5ZNE5_9BACT|nr:hypothetical protein [Pseudobythopirellula maris]TWT89012.1 hypothetical protein Mal64_25030 [Pseudobythopirellula maris]
MLRHALILAALALLATPWAETPAQGQVLDVAPADQPTLGYRYGELSGAERGALRRSFRLSLDALAEAESPEGLARLASVGPLPDVSRPMLRVDPLDDRIADNQGNPFLDDERLGVAPSDMANKTAKAAAPAEEKPRGLLRAIGGVLQSLNPVKGVPKVSLPAAAPAEADPFGDGGFEAEAGGDTTDDPFNTPAAEEPAEEEDIDPFGDVLEGDDPFAGF